MHALEWLPRAGLIGAVHLQALAGAPGHGGDPDRVRDGALRDAEAWLEGGADALLVENFFDAPFYPGRVPAAVVAQMTAIVAAIRERFTCPCGVNVLRNDGSAALAIAHATGCRFVRVNVLTGARLTDQGIIQGRAHTILRERRDLGAVVDILADVDVKHSAPLGPYDPVQEIEDAASRGGASAIVVSGSGTGKPVDARRLRQARGATELPILIGSGVRPESVAAPDGAADGYIVGSWCKQDGRVREPVDAARVAELVAAIERARGLLSAREV